MPEKVMPRLLLCLPIALGLGGCKVDDLFASSFKKYQSCFAEVSRDGTVSKDAAQTACATKYAEEKQLPAVSGTGSFAWCGEYPCDTFTVSIDNRTRDHIIVAAHIAVMIKGQRYTGDSDNPIWVEPMASKNSLITLPRKFTKEERDGFTWSYNAFKALKIDG